VVHAIRDDEIPIDGTRAFALTIEVVQSKSTISV
jgi:hypothetical protein